MVDLIKSGALSKKDIQNLPSVSPATLDDSQMEQPQAQASGQAQNQQQPLSTMKALEAALSGPSAMMRSQHPALTTGIQGAVRGLENVGQQGEQAIGQPIHKAISRELGHNWGVSVPEGTFSQPANTKIMGASATQYPLAEKAGEIGAESIPSIEAMATGGEGALLADSALMPQWVGESLGAGGQAAAMQPGSAQRRAISGTTAAAAGPLAGAGRSVTEKIAQMNPKAYAKHIINVLSGGSELSDNPRKIADITKKLYKEHKGRVSDLYEDLFNGSEKSGMGNVNLKNFNSKYKKHFKDPDFSAKQLGPLTKNLLSDFANQDEPVSARLAHNELVSKLSELKKPYLKSDDATKRETGQILHDLHGAAKKDLTNHFNGTPFQGQYQNANRQFAFHVAPYRHNRVLRQIIGEDTDTRKDMPNAAKHFAIGDNVKDPVLDSNGEPTVPSLATIPMHGGPELKNRIILEALRNEVKRGGDVKDPENLYRAYAELHNKGLGPYLTDSSDKMFKNLSDKVPSTKLPHMSPFQSIYHGIHNPMLWLLFHMHLEDGPLQPIQKAAQRLEKSNLNIPKGILSHILKGASTPDDKVNLPEPSSKPEDLYKAGILNNNEDAQ